VSIKKRKPVIIFVAGLAAAAILAGACTDQKSSSQSQGQAVTEQYAQKLTTAEPYPLSAMSDSSERKNLAERLVRLNDPNKIGYLYGLSSTGQVMAFWTIKGKPSSMGSQLTPTQQNRQGDCSGGCTNVVESMGDDGSFGPEECQAQGIFAFTADSNSLVEWCGPWFYSDAPLKLTSQPLILVDPGAKPSSTAGINGH
jgi:hypothetical protein